jgi:hypothetical protein
MRSLEDKLDNALTSGDDGTEVSRRLSDKILNAFNHAYAVGENEIANKLKIALEANEARRGGPTDHRATYDPLGQAEKWVAFVEARNRYKQVSTTAETESVAAIEALEEMKETYRLWSMS